MLSIINTAASTRFAFAIILVLSFVGFAYEIIKYCFFKKYSRAIIAGLGAILSYITLQLLIEIISQLVKANYQSRVHYFGELPISLIIAEIILLLLIVGALLFDLLRLKNKSLTTYAIKESVDTLNAGICCYNDNGRTILVNSYMEQLSHLLFNETLNNGTIFKNKLQKISHNNSISFDGKVYSIVQNRIDSINEIVIFDTTELNQNIEQLRLQNEKLLEINQKIAELGSKIIDVTTQKEILSAKQSIHNGMNNLILSSIASAQNSADAEKDQILQKWKSNALVLCREANQTEEYSVQNIITNAKALGVNLEINGNFCYNNNKLAYAIVNEAIANAVKHAGARNIAITLSQNEIKISNDGKIPTESITLSGGLSTIKSQVKDLIINQGELFELIVIV